MVDRGELLLADVAVLGDDRFADVLIAMYIVRYEVVWRVHVGRGEHWLASERPNTGFVQHLIVTRGGGGLALAHRGLHHRPSRFGIGVKHERYRVEKLLPFLGRDGHEERTIGRDAGEQLRRRTELLAKRKTAGVMIVDVTPSAATRTYLPALTATPMRTRWRHRLAGPVDTRP